MINHPPENWEYNDSMEMLFLFYQCSDELLSEITPDSYALPLHNTLTLLREVEDVFFLLKEHGAIGEFYLKYIPPIIEEFLQQAEKDYLFKALLGARFSSILTGFKEAEKESSHLQDWLELVRTLFTTKEYLNVFREEIIKLVTTTKKKCKLLCCISNFYSTLRWIGYSREYLYRTTKQYFANQKITANDTKTIANFLNIFDGKPKQYDFLILLDVDSIEYIDSISEDNDKSMNIEKIDIEKERDELEKDPIAAKMLHEYESWSARLSKAHKKLAIVRYSDDDLDPFAVAYNFSKRVAFLQAFARYFKHFYFSKQIYVFLQKDDSGRYLKIIPHSNLQKRPFVEQSIIDSRIRNIIYVKSMGPRAYHSIARAINMHAEAFDSRSTLTIFKTFWTALEALFSSENVAPTRDKIFKGVLQIIQKTYILKKMRALFVQLNDAVSLQERENLSIDSFDSFLCYFARYKADSSEMKKIYALLKDNPLLRTRLFTMRKDFNKGKDIKKILDDHSKKIEWQLKRLYRIRNIATHLGRELNGAEVALNHLHNYFDFIVNYMLCKAENDNYVASTSAVVFEAKNDNQIYDEFLKTKKDEDLSGDNYLNLLFGPDKNLVKYQFEH